MDSEGQLAARLLLRANVLNTNREIPMSCKHLWLRSKRAAGRTSVGYFSGDGRQRGLEHFGEINLLIFDIIQIRAASVDAAVGRRLRSSKAPERIQVQGLERIVDVADGHAGSLAVGHELGRLFHELVQAILDIAGQSDGHFVRQMGDAASFCYVLPKHISSAEHKLVD